MWEISFYLWSIFEPVVDELHEGVNFVLSQVVDHLRFRLGGDLPQNRRATGKKLILKAWPDLVAVTEERKGERQPQPMERARAGRSRAVT